jgi:hypothetical protein
MKFNQWFTIATFQIAACELPKIHNELEGHVLDAIESHQQTGLSRAEAEEMAVLELGDPLEANLMMKRMYLTVQETTLVNQKVPAPPALIVFTPIPFIVYAVYARSWRFVPMLLILLPGVTQYFFSRWASRTPDPEKRYRIRVLGEVSTLACFLLAAVGQFVVIRQTMPGGAEYGYALAGLVAIAGMVWHLRSLSLLRKLRPRA